MPPLVHITIKVIGPEKASAAPLSVFILMGEVQNERLVRCHYPSTLYWVHNQTMPAPSTSNGSISARTVTPFEFSEMLA